MGEDPAFAGDKDGVACTAYAHLPDEPAEPLQVHVGGDHGAQGALRRRPEHRYGMGHHHHVAPALVVVGLGPIRPAREGRLQVPVLLPVSVGFGGELGQAQLLRADAGAMDVRREAIPPGVEGAEGEGHGRAVDVLVASDELSQQTLQPCLRGQRLAQGGRQHSRSLLDGPEHGLGPVHGGFGGEHGLALGGSHRLLSRQADAQRQGEGGDPAAQEDDPEDQTSGEAAEARSGEGRVRRRRDRAHVSPRSRAPDSSGAGCCARSTRL